MQWSCTTLYIMYVILRPFSLNHLYLVNFAEYVIFNNEIVSSVRVIKYAFIMHHNIQHENILVIYSAVFQTF